MAHSIPKDSFGALASLSTAGGEVRYYRLGALEERGLCTLARLPYSIRVILEAVLRAEGRGVTADDVSALAAYDSKQPPDIEVPYSPSRVLLQDFTGVPAVVDLAALRSAMTRLGGDPKRVDPRVPVDLVIDHSLMVDFHGTPSAAARNEDLEFARNHERYELLRWGQLAFENLSVIPPASGICHQVNLEYLATVVRRQDVEGTALAYPDTLVGTDSHTTMINGLGVVGWGVGGIEAEAAMLGQPLYMLPPPVVGVELRGKLPRGATATDLVLTITQLLRTHGVVGKFVEFFGAGLDHLSVPDRATIANMAPEYGATIGFFPVDEQTLAYLTATGRDAQQVELVRDYSVAQGLFRTTDSPTPEYQDTLSFELGSVRPSLAGPKRPQDRVELTHMQSAFRESLAAPVAARGFAVRDLQARVRIDLEGGAVELRHGSVVIAAITSCTNTSNPSVMLAAGLLARNAVKRGLRSRPWVKTSLAPGSTVVTEYLREADVLEALETLGFHVVGYGCTTCIGNSGPLPPPVADALDGSELVVSSVLSGNRNFEGRVHQQVKASYLGSPPLVVAYALAGTVDIDFERDPIGQDEEGRSVYLRDLWPSPEEIAELVKRSLNPAVFTARYGSIETGNPRWNEIEVDASEIFAWSPDSTYIHEPPFFEDVSPEGRPIESIRGARVLVYVGDSVTTDHISPAGAFSSDSPAGRFLSERGVAPRDFNSYGSRRGNDRVMTRGTFANIRLKNQLAPGTEGGFTTNLRTGEVTTIFEAAEGYREASIPTIVIAGKDYGMGSSRDWAAKGPLLLGVRAVIARSFERIHRSNLVGMGILPLELANGESAEGLGLDGRETYDIELDDGVKPRQQVEVTATAADGTVRRFTTTCRLDTPIDLEYYRHGGILRAVLAGMLSS
ncbi:MAG: aconitate hydratase AcnA [bacterium]